MVKENSINLKRDRRTLKLILLYFIYISMYGIIVKVTANNSILFALKTYFPELILGFSIIPQISKKNFVDKKSFLLIVNMLCIVILNYIIHGATAQSFYWWRDLIIPIIVAVFLKGCRFSTEEITNFLHDLAVYGKIYLVLGFVLALVENRMGWEWTSNFYAGHQFYGRDPYTNVMVNQYLGYVRTPGLSANFTTFAFYSCICLFSIKWDLTKGGRGNNFQSFLWTALAFAICLLSTNKSSILALGIVVFVAKANEMRGRNRIIANMLLIASGVLLLLSLFAFDSTTDLASTYLSGSLLRFNAWATIIKNTNAVEMIIPYNMFLYGAGTDSSSAAFGLSFFDNFYLYVLMTQGIVGLYLIISYFFKALRQSKGLGHNYYQFLCYIVSFGAIIGLTSNIIQGRAYFTVAIILISCIGYGVRQVNP